MKIFLAGGSGALGSRLIVKLVSEGHSVAATTRQTTKLEAIRRIGAQPVIMEPLNADSVTAAVRASRPDVIIHQLTSLSNVENYRLFDREFEATNQLRTVGIDNLLAAAETVGATRFIAQSYGGWPTERSGPWSRDESAPLDRDVPSSMRKSFDAIQHIETMVPACLFADGIVLRYGAFYGPGTAYSRDGFVTKMVRKRRFPIVGNGKGVSSFLHIEDAADATCLAVTNGNSGVYNIADDDPVEMADWLNEYSAMLGAKAPRHIPSWIGQLAAGESAVLMMTQVRGLSNLKAKRELRWTPAHKSWRSGMRDMLR